MLLGRQAVRLWMVGLLGVGTRSDRVGIALTQIQPPPQVRLLYLFLVCAFLLSYPFLAITFVFCLDLQKLDDVPIKLMGL